MIGVVGINYKTAAIEIRERLVFSEQEIEEFIYSARDENGYSEIVVLSTCNRTEVYFNLVDPERYGDCRSLIDGLLAFKNIEENLSPYFYTHRENAAVTHLFRVAAGLNSMVLGENQVLGQVKDAYKISASRKFTSAVLNRLFHKAFEVGKMIRSETAINEGASSISYAAVELAGKIFRNLPAHPVLLIGAGETGELTLQSLAHRGSDHLHVANRTFSRARELADRYQAEAVPFDRLMEQFLHCDIVITATASPEPLIEHAFVKQAMHKRHNRTLFLIDLSVPRDIESSTRKLEEVFVYDVDDLQAVVAHNYEKRRQEIEKAEKILEKQVREFSSWLSSLSLGPTIERLKAKFESLPRKELRSLQNKLPEETYARVLEFTEFLQGKYLGLIVKNLKELSHDGRRLEYVDLVNSLFELWKEQEK